MAGSAVHAPLQQLQSIDLPLNGSSPPGLNQGRQHRIVITFDAAHKGVQLRSSRVGQPGLELRCSVLAGLVLHQCSKACCEFAGLGNIGSDSRYRRAGQRTTGLQLSVKPC